MVRQIREVLEIIFIVLPSFFLRSGTTKASTVLWKRRTCNGIVRNTNQNQRLN